MPEDFHEVPTSASRYDPSPSPKSPRPSVKSKPLPRLPRLNIDATGPELALVIYDFEPYLLAEYSTLDTASMLPIQAGRIVRVLNREATGWWEGELDGQRGWFPYSYVDIAPDILNQDQEWPPSEYFSAFPSNELSTPVQVLNALRLTHDYHISAISTFVLEGSAHHSIFDIFFPHDFITEIKDYGINLLTSLDVLMQRTDVSVNQLNAIKAAKEDQCETVMCLLESVYLLTLCNMSKELEEEILLQEATAVLQAGAKSITAILNACLSQYRDQSPSPIYVSQPEAVDNDAQVDIDIVAQRPTHLAPMPFANHRMAIYHPDGRPILQKAPEQNRMRNPEEEEVTADVKDVLERSRAPYINSNSSQLLHVYSGRNSIQDPQMHEEEKSREDSDKKNRSSVAATHSDRSSMQTFSSFSANSSYFSLLSNPSWLYSEFGEDSEIDRLPYWSLQGQPTIHYGFYPENFNPIAAALASRTSLSTCVSSSASTDYGSTWFARRLTTSTMNTLTPSRPITIMNTIAEI